MRGPDRAGMDALGTRYSDGYAELRWIGVCNLGSTL